MEGIRKPFDRFPLHLRIDFPAPPPGGAYLASAGRPAFIFVVCQCDDWATVCADRECGVLPRTPTSLTPYNASMSDLPVMLRVVDKVCVIIGGGGVAARRLTSLLETGAQVTVIAPQVTEAIDATAKTGRCRLVQRAYEAGDLAGAFLVVIATDDPAVNLAAAAEADQRGVLINRTDAAQQGDLTIPAHVHHGPVTLTAHTSGISAAAATAILKETAAALDPAWPGLLTVVEPYRAVLQRDIRDRSERRRRLLCLTDATALKLYKDHGAEALRQRCQTLVADLPSAVPEGMESQSA